MELVVLGEAAFGLARFVLDAVVFQRDLPADLVPPVGEGLGRRDENGA